MQARTVDTASALALAGFSLIMLRQLKGIPQEGVLFPQCLLLLLLGCSAVLLLRAWFVPEQKQLFFFDHVSPWKWVGVAGLFLAQVLGTLYISFNLSMGVGMFATLCLLHSRRDPRALALNALVSALFVGFFYVFFTRLMHIYFPEPLFG